MDNRENRQELIQEEKKKMRRLRFLVDLTTSVLYQDTDLTVDEARSMIRGVEGAVLRMFPGKKRTFDMLLVPRFERIMYERWGVGLDYLVH